MKKSDYLHSILSFWMDLMGFLGNQARGKFIKLASFGPPSPLLNMQHLFVHMHVNLIELLVHASCFCDQDLYKFQAKEYLTKSTRGSIYADG